MSVEVWTVRRVLSWCTDNFRSRDLPSPRLDAEVLLAHTLAVDRVRLYMDLDRPMSTTELTTIRGYIERRRNNEPVAHIRGFREFWGHSFLVSADVLVPRPETEMLVELSLAWIAERRDTEVRVLDLCAGSGCIGLSIAKESNALVVLSDVSEAAIHIARNNAERLEVGERVSFVTADLFDGVREQRFDVIVSNPPYLPSAEIETLSADVRNFDPRIALDGGKDGLSFYQRIANAVPHYLAANGLVLLEVGLDQADQVAGWMESALPEHVVTVHPDLASIPRVVEVRTR